MAWLPSRRRVTAIRCRKRSSSHGVAHSRILAFAACTLAAFSNSVACVPPDGATRRLAKSPRHPTRIAQRSHGHSGIPVARGNCACPSDHSRKDRRHASKEGSSGTASMLMPLALRVQTSRGCAVPDKLVWHRVACRKASDVCDLRGRCVVGAVELRRKIQSDLARPLGI